MEPPFGECGEKDFNWDNGQIVRSYSEFVKKKLGSIGAATTQHICKKKQRREVPALHHD